MLKLLFLLLFTNNVLSLEYVSLKDNKVYDIEIIVFAYDNPLPNNETYNNNNIISLEDSISLEEKPDELEFINTVVLENSDELTMPIDGDSDNTEALTWFKHDETFFKLNNLWEKLEKNPSTTPLLHKSWRQIPSEFNSPIYVNLLDLDKNINENEKVDSEEFINESINSNSIQNNNAYLEDDVSEELIDYLLEGKVALSEGRYLHFGHNINMQRTYFRLEEQRAMKFSLTERRQIKEDELHYFDNPWFGSIVKITRYMGEEENDETTNE